MKYKDTGFRALYKNFVAFMLKDNLKQCIEGYPNADKANWNAFTEPFVLDAEICDIVEKMKSRLE